ncbi:hypothetical protein CYMTET_5269 [Cymbomonas tetramitiformis]|uniref:Uncharacterized protein n=1 Tax=Cymbomonas tetramitiformis TaxID=36881 RepID=A0AAE0LJ87_9CHLO|nr:hypothetical protein CYMTET_5269 [Cymbomonas tetramitiformis]
MRPSPESAAPGSLSTESRIDLDDSGSERVSKKLPENFSVVGTAEDGRIPETVFPVGLQRLCALIVDEFPLAFQSELNIRRLYKLATWVENCTKISIKSEFCEWEEAYRLFNPDTLRAPERLHDDWKPAYAKVAVLPARNPGWRAEFRKFKGTFKDVAERSGYSKITKQQVDDAISAKARGGLELEPPDPTTFRICMYYRGVRRVERWWRSWMTLYISRKYHVDQLGRLVVLYRKLSGPLANKWSIRMLKDFDKNDVDMLLPGATVKLGWSDSLLIYGSMAVSILVALYQLFTNRKLPFTNVDDAVNSGWLLLAPFYACYQGWAAYKTKQRNYERQKNVYLMYHVTDCNGMCRV